MMLRELAVTVKSAVPGRSNACWRAFGAEGIQGPPPEEIIVII